MSRIATECHSNMQTLSLPILQVLALPLTSLPISQANEFLWARSNPADRDRGQFPQYSREAEGARRMWKSIQNIAVKGQVRYSSLRRNTLRLSARPRSTDPLKAML